MECLSISNAVTVTKRFPVKTVKGSREKKMLKTSQRFLGQ